MKIDKDQEKILESSEQWYLSRDTIAPGVVDCSDATKVSIEKYHGCVEYRNSSGEVGLFLWLAQVKAYFGHRPEPEGLIYVEKQANGKWSCETIDLEFSD